MWKQFLNYIDLARAYIIFNWRSQWEYRGAFFLEAAGMFMNNVIWIAFWTFFFHTFPTVPSWGLKDIITLWAIASTGYGLAFVLCGNARLLAEIIAKGELDTWMLYPRRLLFHFILGRMKASAFGDMVFGVVIYILFVKPDLSHLLLFSVLTIAIAILFAAFNIIIGSLAFFLGQAENIVFQWEMAMITFSCYPSPLFEGKVRILLYTLIPAIFVSYYPIETLKRFSLMDAVYTFIGAMIFAILAMSVFYLGLKKYESGNLTAMRG